MFTFPPALVLLPLPVKTILKESSPKIFHLKFSQAAIKRYTLWVLYSPSIKAPEEEEKYIFVVAKQYKFYFTRKVFVTIHFKKYMNKIVFDN